MSRIPCALVCLIIGAAACSSNLDAEREPVDTGTFGNTVVTLACKRIAYLEDLNDGDGVVDVRGDALRDVCRFGLAPPGEAPDTVKALQAKRDVLIDAIDTTFPDGFLPDLQGYLTSNAFLTLYDDGTTVAAVDSLVEMLEFMAADEELAPALERLGVRAGYLPITESLGTVRAVVNYPDLHEFLLTVVDEITDGGSARATWQDLIAAAGATLRNASAVAEPDDPERTGALALDFLLAERALLGTSRTVPLVRRDWRGLARVATAGGQLPAPFVDLDADGLADADSLGRFVDADGNPVVAPTPFALPEGDEDVPWLYRDGEGRALDAADGNLVYEYVDLDETVFAALVRDSIDLFDPQQGTALDALRGASALMGSRQFVTHEFATGESLEYRGYDTAEAPLLDMVHAYLQLLRDPDIDDVLGLGRTLLVDHEPEAARLFEAMIDTARVADMFPDASIDATSPLFDDLMLVMRDMLAEPGLVEDLLRAMEDPQVAELGLRFRDYMKYKDQFHIDPDTHEVVGSFGTEVDRSAADSNFNRSLMQRLLHLIADSSGARMCNKQDAVVKDPFLGVTLQTYDECELLQVDDMAVLYVQSIAFARDGNGNLIPDSAYPTGYRPKAFLDFRWNNSIISGIATDDFLEDETGIDGFRSHPTPAALNRVLFLDPLPEILANTMDPAVTRYGDQYRTYHGGTLPVWETGGFYDQIRPIVQVFADHDAEHLFVALLAVLHNHWPSRDSINHQHLDPDGHAYAYASDAGSFEPALVEVLDRRLLLDALVTGAPTLNQVTVNGKTMPAILASAGRYLLTPQPGLTNRRGETTSTTSDGRPVDVLSPWQLLADAYERKTARLVEAGGEGQAWESAVSGLVDVLVRADAVPDVGWRFRNPRFRGVAVAGIDFLESRLDAHRQAGDLDAWLGTDLPEAAQAKLAHPLFAGAADFILSLQARPEARAQIEALVAYLVDEISYNETFRTSLTSMADILQLALDDADIVPIARVAGEALRPERGWLDTQLTFVQAARHADENQALVEMMRNLYVEYRPGHTAIGDLIDGISEVHRARPWEDLGADYSADDYRALLTGVAHFFDDEKRGLRKFIAIIQSRNL